MRTMNLNACLWNFIKSNCRDASGVASLKREGIAYSESKVKAEILNQQFTSVFTSESTIEPLTDLGINPHSTVANIILSPSSLLHVKRKTPKSTQSPSSYRPRRNPINITEYTK
jgi:hypothetical protein